MTVSAVLGLILALGLVLGLLGLAVGAARRFAGVTGAGRSGLRLNVLQRTAIGPRQGVAAVRVADRVLVVSVGDGGVHLLTELTPQESLKAGLRDASGDAGDDTASAAGATGATARGLRALGLLRVLAAAGFSLSFASARVHAEPLSAAPARVQAAQNGGTGNQAGRGAQSGGAAAQNQTQNASGRGSSANTNPAAQPNQGGRGAAPAATASTQKLNPAQIAQLPAQGSVPRLALQFGDGSKSDLRISGTVGTVLFIGLLATLPTLLLLMTSFTRVLVVLHFMRQALGTQSVPPAQLLAALALLLTGFIMAPTIAEVNSTAIQPWMHGEIDEVQMMQTGSQPLRAFMLRQVPEQDLAHFVELSGQPMPDAPEDVSLPVLMSAFATSELRAAFQMGFAIFLPFVVIDLVVSAVLTSMGMFMLPPTMIALPCKLLLFVLVDGWSLLVGSLVHSFV